MALERLVTTTQAAQLLGLSLQGVHYRIKKNQLKSIKKTGKIFVYIDDKLIDELLIKTNNKNIKHKNQDIIDVKNDPCSVKYFTRKNIKNSGIIIFPILNFTMLDLRK